MSFIVYSFAVLKSVIYGLSVFFTGNLTSSVDVLDVLALRFILSFAVLWILKILRIVKINIGIKDFVKKNEHSKNIKDILIASMFQPCLYMFFETLGISMTTGITAGVILALTPITSCICEMIFLKEKTTYLQKVLLIIGIIGVIYIAVNTNSSEGKDTFAGIMFMFFAVISGSLFATFSRKSSDAFSAMEITYVASALGMIVFNAVNVGRHLIQGNILNYFRPYFDVGNMIGFIFLGIVSSIIATEMNVFALARMQISTMASFIGVSTLTTISVGAIFNGEQIYAFHIIGLVLIATGMIGVSYIQIKKDKNKRLTNEYKPDNFNKNIK